MKRLSELGEDWVISQAKRIFGTGYGWVGIGDDAAVVQMGNAQAITTIDMLVEGIHFCRETAEPEDIGFKAIAVNVSDIAAMGGVPRWAVVGLALPADTSSEWVERLLIGMQEMAGACALPIAGGDTVGTKGPIVISVTVVGQSNKPVLRRGCRDGWTLFITGDAGDAAAGLWASQHPEAKSVAPDAFEYVYRRFSRPLPQLEAGKLLALGDACMLDNSDGLARSLAILAEENGLSAQVTKGAIPISREARCLAAQAGIDPLEWALFGGEDYNLVGALPSERLPEIRRLLEEQGFAMHEIGHLYEGTPQILLDGEPLPPRSYQHFG